MIERRFMQTRPTIATATRAGTPGSVVLVGDAAVFDTETTIGSFFREKIAPNAFDRAIRTDDVRAAFNHDSNRLLGRTASGTLRLSQDRRGLKYEIYINSADVLAMSVVEQVRRGDITGSSFAFTVDPDDERWEYAKGQVLPLRTVLRASLRDVGPVVYPAYEQTTATVS